MYIQCSVILISDKIIYTKVFPPCSRVKMSLSKFGKSHMPRSHEECRAIVCCVCSRKVKQTPTSTGFVSEKLSILVRKFVFEGYNTQNSLYPTAMCVSCRLTLSVLDKVRKTRCRLMVVIQGQFYT